MKRLLWLIAGAAAGCGTSDLDRDGVPAGLDCDDRDANVTVGDTFYADGDGDGYGDDATAVQACTAPDGHVAQAGDCLDGSALIHPAAPELCNGVDDDCDGELDEAGGALWYADADGDGVGDATHTTVACDPSAAWVSTTGDCDDLDASTWPGAPERCDGIDNDCDGAIDEDAPDASAWYRDMDGDGVGTDGVAYACEPPDGFTSMDGDCDDADPAVHPGHDEVCDGLDNDCDGTVDVGAVDAGTWYADADADGYGDPTAPVQACARPGGAAVDPTDCDDTDATVNPETWWYADADADAFGDVAGGAVQQCAAPAGFARRDGDCDDADADVHPDASEWCDGRDEDCDGTPDDDAVDAALWYVDADRDGYGSDAVVTWSCTAPEGPWVAAPGDCDDTRATVHADHDEVCDAVDNDCDGLVDDDDPTLIEAPFWYPDQDHDGFGTVVGAAQQCVRPTGRVDDDTDCDDHDRDVNTSAVEICDGLDNDCDGVVDAGDGSTWIDGAFLVYADADADGYGDDSAPRWACELQPGQVERSGDCDDTDADVYPGAPEACGERRDRDCDGHAGGDDRDGDGVLDCEACGPEVANVYAYRDDDGDGFGDASGWTVVCDGAVPVGFTRDDTDCDDRSPITWPGADEVCDHRDNDCDGVVPAWEEDQDHDGACVLDDCDDHDAEVYVGAPERCDDGVDHDCDGDILTCISGVRAVEDDAVVWMAGPDPSGELGYDVSGGHDMDGDGYLEVAIGAPGDGGGLVYVFDGPVDAGWDPGAPDARVIGAHDGDEVGRALEMVPDLDGDGVADLLVSGAGVDGGVGATWFLPGPVRGEVQVRHVATRIAFGGDRVAVADLHGDGQLDVVLGDLDAVNPAGNETGAVGLWRGPGDGEQTLDDAFAVIYAAEPLAELGAGLAPAGDTDGDGVADLFVGAPRAGGAGRAWLFTAVPGGIVDATDADVEFDFGNTAYRDAGMAVGGPGDMNGDGRDDVLVGVPGEGTIAPYAGAVYLFRGGAAGGVLDRDDASALFQGADWYHSLGDAMAAPGDVDGDGVRDIALGASMWDGVINNGGGVFVFRGPFSAGSYTTADADAIRFGPENGDKVGQAVAAVGDLTGDGLPDLLVGAPGSPTSWAARCGAYLFATAE